jgi:hypothetical protein
VPASTIHAVRLFHRLSVEGLAICFDVTPRTVFRWEERGVDPALLEPGWRRELLLWLLERFERTGVTDNRKKEG